MDAFNPQSPEAVAFALMREIASHEQTYNKENPKEAYLALYSECLSAVLQEPADKDK